MVPLLRPKQQQLALGQQEDADRLELPQQQRRAADAPPLHAFLRVTAGAAGRRAAPAPGSLRLRLSACDALAIVAVLRRVRRQQRRAPRARLRAAPTRRRAPPPSRAAPASAFSRAAWTSAWQAGQLSADGRQGRVPHCGQRGARAPTGTGGGCVMRPARRRGRRSAGRRVERPGDRERHRRLLNFHASYRPMPMITRPRLLEADRIGRLEDERRPASDDVERRRRRTALGLRLQPRKAAAEGDRA